MGTIFAPNSTGKSFVAIDAVIRKAAGWDLGPFVNPEPRPVLYLAAEDRHGIEFRIAATALDLGLDLSLPIAVAEPPVEYCARDFAGAVVEMAKRLFPGQPPGLIVVDTLGAGIGAGSLNDDVTAAPAMNQFHRLSALLDRATVLVLHHPSKTDARERGSGVIRDRADFAISLAADRTGRIVTATNVKMRNGARGDRLVYRLGEIDDGTRTATPGTTLRVISIDGDTARHQQQAAEAEPSDNLSPDQRLILNAIAASGTVTAVTEGDGNASWRASVTKAMRGRSEGAIRKAISTGLKVLITKGLIEKVGKDYRVTKSHPVTPGNGGNAADESVTARPRPTRAGGDGNASRPQRGTDPKKKARPETGAPSGARRATSEART